MSERFDQWHKRHAKRKYTPAFDAALRSIVNSEGADFPERVWAFAILHSWGWNPDDPQDYAVDEACEPYTLAGVAREMGIDKQRVSEAVQDLSEQNRLHYHKKRLYPVDDPSIASPFAPPNKNRDSPDEFGRKGENFKRFRTEWEAANPAVAIEREEARAALERERGRLKRINREELAAYKLWLKAQASGESQQNAENGPPLPTKDVRDSSKNGSATPPGSEALSFKPDESGIGRPSSSLSSSSVEEPTGAGRTTTNPLRPEARAVRAEHAETAAEKKAEPLNGSARSESDAVIDAATQEHFGIALDGAARRRLYRDCDAKAPGWTAVEGKTAVERIRKKVDPRQIRKSKPAYLQEAIPNELEQMRAEQQQEAELQSRRVPEAPPPPEEVLRSIEEFLGWASPDNVNRPSMEARAAELREQLKSKAKGAAS